MASGRSAALVSRIGLPLSMASTGARASSFSSMRSAILLRTRARSAGAARPQASLAAWAASSASSMSSAVERAIVQTTDPSIGDTLSNFWPFTGGTHLPPMKLS